jgi:uncharacterized protein (TIGR04222 family)
VAQGKSKVSYHDLHNAGMSSAAEVEQRLVERGLIEQPDNTRLARWLPFALMLSLTVMGVVKIGIGLWRDKPVIFLVLASVVALVTAFFFLRQIRRTRAGDELLKLLRARHTNLAAASSPKQSACEALSPTMLAMSVGLFGAGVLAGGPLAGLQSLWMSHQQAYRGNGGCGGGCSGGGCGAGGGGGCGGGGCGGGGCGGCGGG